MAGLGGIFALVYLACVVAIIIYIIRLLSRFVSAHERVASALEVVARKLKDDASHESLSIAASIHYSQRWLAVSVPHSRLTSQSRRRAGRGGEVIHRRRRPQFRSAGLAAHE